MQITETHLPGVVIIEPKVFGDARGFFMETWQRDRYAEVGLPTTWVQDNLSQSRRGVLRGLHMQYPNPQGKLVTVLKGEVFDVAVDIRLGSPTFGQWVGVFLSGDNKKQLYIPPGFAHGFVVTSDEVLFSYKCTDFYDPKSEIALLWNDPDVGIKWPVVEPALSAKDMQGVRLKDLPHNRLMPYVP
jgi:dTDP-4-dehydrorhamnose 3,5-epimerase